MTFNNLGLRPELLNAVEGKGYSRPTPIQIGAIPPILEGRDVLGGAQTGTGKTAAFTLPLLQLLSQSGMKPSRHPRALIVCPTRELAAQIRQSIVDYGVNLPFKSDALFGGVKINPQITRIRGGLDIVVATPGRLLDHLNQRTLNLSQVEYLILDEADRMLDMGFIRDIKKIIGMLPPKRQNMLFSATYSKEIRKLSKELLNNPVLVEVNPENSAAETVEQVVHRVEKAHKQHLLSHLIKEEDWYQVLVFTRTKYGASKLARKLKQAGIPSADIHGNKSQAARTRALKEFKAGKLQALVATDIAARGLDIVKLSHVVNFDLPQIAEDYVHRIGRTGRAGEEGLAVSFCASDERDKLKAIEKLLGRRLPVVKAEGFKPPPPAVQQGAGQQNATSQNSRKPGPGRRPNAPSEGGRTRREDNWNPGNRSGDEEGRNSRPSSTGRNSSSRGQGGPSGRNPRTGHNTSSRNIGGSESRSGNGRNRGRGQGRRQSPASA